ncbi:putative ADP-ribosylation factor GTPase-activating protein AGD14 [Balamuthia mandrillaris]
MSAGNKRQEEKHQKILRNLLQLPGNKKCMDCTEKGPFYACTTFGTFVCPVCSGIHREFGHRVKSISMATFKPEEVEFLQEMGNERARDIWLAKWSSDQYPEPDSADKARVREFMKLKYLEKRWYRKDSKSKEVSPTSSGSASPNRRERSRKGKGDTSPVKVEPLQKILGNDIPPIHYEDASTKKEKTDIKPPADAFLVWDNNTPSAAAPTPVQAAPSRPPTNGLEAIFSTPAPSTTTSATTVSSIWPPPQPQQYMQFQAITPQAFQQMTPQQQQAYLQMQQQWIMQQQQMMTQQLGYPQAYPQVPYGAAASPFPAQQQQQQQTYPYYNTGYQQPYTTPSVSSPLLAPTSTAASTAAPKKADTTSHLFADLSPIGGAKPASNGHSSSAPSATSQTSNSSSTKTNSLLDFGSFATPSSAPKPQTPSSLSNDPFGMGSLQQSLPTTNASAAKPSSSSFDPFGF